MRKNKSYHHGNLRVALLEEARGVVEESGEMALSLRACAREVGVDIAAAYRHFRSKDEVLAAVAADGFTELAGQMRAAMDQVGRSQDRSEEYFLGCGRAYVHFGLEHRHLYQLMFGGRCTIEAVAKQREKSGHEDGLGAYDLLSDALDLLVEASMIPKQSRPNAEFLAWSSVHGLVSLLLAGRGGIQEEGYDAATERVCRTLLQGLRVS